MTLTRPLAAAGIALLAGCANPPAQPPAALAAAPQPVPVMDTVVNTLQALSADCAVRRTLDGRVICGRPLEQEPHTVVAAAPQPAAPAVDEAAPVNGEYVVIGSFRDAANARRWARYNDEFGTTLKPVQRPDGTTYHRVVVGPLNGASTSLFREILDAVGLADTWPLALCTSGRVDAAGDCPGLGEAKLADVGQP